MGQGLGDKRVRMILRLYLQNARIRRSCKGESNPKKELIDPCSTRKCFCQERDVVIL